MVKEQCVICIDNSEWMRNGDYNPTRMSSQQDAANLVCGRKTGSNPETTVAVMTMGGSAPTVQVALTTDLGQLLKCLSQIKISGEIHFSTSIKVAQLALKRRSSEQSSNKRIVAFIGSPLKESKEDLEKLGLRLRKNNIAVDIVNFGEQEENTDKLDAFINSVNSGDNSHLVTIPPGPHILADLILSSPILHTGSGDAASSSGGGADGGGEFEFGFDPSLDPELAMVLRLSMEEENRRQERLRQEQSGESQGEKPQTTTATTTTQQPQQQQQATMDDDVEMDEDEALREAIRLSLAESGSNDATGDNQEEDDEEMDEAEALRLAMEMSKQDQTGDNDENIADVLQDQDHANDILKGMKKDDDKK